MARLSSSAAISPGGGALGCGGIGSKLFRSSCRPSVRLLPLRPPRPRGQPRVGLLSASFRRGARRRSIHRALRPSDPGLRLRKCISPRDPGGTSSSPTGVTPVPHARFNLFGPADEPARPPLLDAALDPGAEPPRSGGLVRYRNPRLSIDRIWKETAPPPGAPLSNPGGASTGVRDARADAKVKLENGERLEGTGYVERSTTSIAPWKLRSTSSGGTLARADRRRSSGSTGRAAPADARLFRRERESEPPYETMP